MARTHRGTMRILLVDNSKTISAKNTPLLKAVLQDHGVVESCEDLDDVIAALSQSWDAIVLSGSSMNVSESIKTQAISKDVLALLRFHDVAVLGVCFGMQLMAVAYGGEVSRMATRREGTLRTRVCHVATGRSTLLSHLCVRTTEENGVRRWLRSGGPTTWYSHQDVVARVPPGFVTTAVTGDGLVAAMESRRLKRYGVQFHPERSSEDGVRVIRRFLAIASEGRLRVPCRNKFTAMDAGGQGRRPHLREKWSAPGVASRANEGDEVCRNHDELVKNDTTCRTISAEQWNRIALCMGRANHASVAEEEGIPSSHVLLVWEEFRRRFRIPTILI